MPADHRAHVTASPWPGVYATDTESQRHFGKHWHATHGVGVLEQGAQASASGRGGVEAFAGDLITTNPGEVHDGRPLHGPSRRWRMVYFEPGAMAVAAERQASDIELHQPVLRDAQLRSAMYGLLGHIAAWSRCGPDTPASAVAALACDEALVNACGLLLREHAAPSTPVLPDRRLEQVRERLCDEPQHVPGLAALADLAGLSKFQLLRRFAAAYGVTPHAWLLQRRAEEARSFIRRGDALAEAAAAAGFADQSHMTRIFSRQFGFTPGAWRQAMHPRR